MTHNLVQRLLSCRPVFSLSLFLSVSVCLCICCECACVCIIFRAASSKYGKFTVKYFEYKCGTNVSPEFHYQHDDDEYDVSLKRTLFYFPFLKLNTGSLNFSNVKSLTQAATLK